ncbi:glycosyltransferase family 39 protein [Echinicola marina]|uniref:ArnT family glycosyltransferase n=1 Tax=Echinicola marina TaxID=2859768 RepID=UPI001CF68CBB|nr:glycosyltransferase family 39 protein [Echinicola marina]UCS94280.1 glycosyltransferase family 39 protein [Echinicola marina]
MKLMIDNFSSSIQNRAWPIILLFILLVAPFALQFHLHYPDEMYYTDAAIKMMQNGDYLTTYLGSGELRFKKPILTYWTALAGFKLFGISAFSSRIFFLLSGAAIVFLVHRIAHLIFHQKNISHIAICIAASHGLIIFSSTRSIPDILLALFMTLSALGATGLIKYGNNAGKKYLWMFYLGIGIAFEVKGLPAAALGGIAIIYLLVNPWQRISWKKMAHLPSVLTMLIIGLFWFWAMYIKFGPTYLSSFMEDQVGIRVGSKLLLIGTNFCLAVVLYFAMFFPWIVPGISSVKKNLSKIVDTNKAFFGFVATWSISMILMTSMVSVFYERYLLPVLPLSAVALAWLIAQNPNGLKNKSIRWTSAVFLILNLVIILTSLYLNLGLGTLSILTAFGLMVSSVILFSLYLAFKRSWQPATVLTTAILLLFFSLPLFTKVISLPDQGVQTAKHIQSIGLPEGSKIAFIGNLHTSSKIRIGLGTEYSLVNLPKASYQDHLAEFDYLVCDEETMQNLKATDYKIDVASTNWNAKYIPDILLSILEGTQDDWREKGTKKFYWVEKR